MCSLDQEDIILYFVCWLSTLFADNLPFTTIYKICIETKKMVKLSAAAYAIATTTLSEAHGVEWNGLE